MTNPTRFLVALCCTLVSALHAALVPPGGYTNDFSLQPPAADFSTRAIGSGGFFGAGEFTNAAALDAAARTNSAALIIAQCASVAGTPPTANGSAVWATNGGYLQTRATANGATLLLGRLVNNAGGDGTGARIIYDFVTNRASTTTEEVRGHRVFYSLTGLADSWTLIPELSQTPEGTLAVDLTFATPWTNNGTLYILWADDNGSGTPDDANNIDNFYVEVTGTALAAKVVAPANGASLPDTNSVTIQVQANPGPNATLTGVGIYETSTGLLGSLASAPYQIAVNLQPGVYNVYAVATNNLNAFVYSPTNSFTVVNVPFSIALFTPTNNTTHGTPTNVFLSAAGYAGDGQSFTGVGFYDETTGFLASATTAPFNTTVYFNGGTFRLYAVATNSAGTTVLSGTNRMVINVPPTNTVAPRIYAQTPPHSTAVSNLTNIVVVFTEPVTGVDAGDLLIDGVPATTVTGTGSNYTFRFPQPAYGQPVVTWAVGHGIQDFGWPTSLPFDATGDGATWGYYLIDQTAPVISARTPGVNASVTNVSQISVTFSETVTGVDASDLLLNGTPALSVAGSGSNYTFAVTEPEPLGGPLTNVVTWATNHGIFDVATTPNAFNRATAGWSFVLDVRTVLVQSNSMWRFVKGLAEASDPTNAWRQLSFDASSWSNAPAPFFFGDPYSNGLSAFTHLSDMASNYSTIYLRREFTVADPTAITNLFISLQVDDGAVVWINGVEARRVNAPGGEVPFTGTATGTTQEPQQLGAAYTVFQLTNNAAAALVPGVNVIAVHALNQSLTQSSDFGFNLQLFTYIPDTEAVPPRVISANPAPGEVASFNSVTINFSENVTGVDAADLLVNGVSATGVSSANARSYTFTFNEPSAGPISVSFRNGHGILDTDQPPKQFNETATGSTLQYWRVVADAPVVASRTPAAGASVSSVSSINVTFSENVTGVDAADLLVNGSPASAVLGSGAAYTFTVAQPSYGAVSVTWAAANGIQDSTGNAFDGTRNTNRWTFTLVDQTAPAIVSQMPAAGANVANLTSLTVTFTEPVTGVSAGDLLLNGVPATNVTGSGAVYTFGFHQPNATVINVAWAANHGIRDTAPVSNEFNAAAPGATWSYTTTDNVPPSIWVDPPASAIVKNLTRINVTFDEPVTGVSAGDLLINNVPAQGVTGSGAGPYAFTFTRPATGSVSVAFAAAHGIQDTAAVPNAFTGMAWSYTLNPGIATDIAVRHVLQMSIDGLAARYLRFYVTNAPARFPNFVRLINEGASTMNARCDYDISETIPNHTSMFTGRPVLQPAGTPDTTHHGYNNNFPPPQDTIHNSGNLTIPYKHSMFDVAHDHGRTTAFHAGKTRLDICDRSYNETTGALDLVGTDNGRDKIDYSNVIDIQGQLISNAVSTLLVDLWSSNPTEYLFFHTAEPDQVGHASGWGSANYSNMVAFIDTQLGRILDALDNNPALMNQTALIVSTDHGGGGGNAVSHTLASHPDNYTIPFFIRAPGIDGGIDAYTLFSNRADPGTGYPDYAVQPQPIRNGDGSNLALSLLALPPIPGSYMNPVWATPAVALRVARGNGQISLFWADLNNEYDLQVADSVNATTWTTITSGINTVEATKTYTVPNPTAPNQFFRLKKRN